MTHHSHSEHIKNPSKERSASAMNELTLKKALLKMLGKPVESASYETTQLHGGTLGDVQLVTGIAQATDGEALPYKIVWKKQQKWERSGDPGSWRREYDLYQSNLGAAFTKRLRWPECYHSEFRDDEIEIWMEYIDGISGEALTIDMLELAAYELGRFQGRISVTATQF
jgi:hypothetical protein